MTEYTTHTADDAAHHARFTEGEAVTAMGANAPANPLHYDRYTDAEAIAASRNGHSLDSADGTFGDAVYVDDQGKVDIGTGLPGNVLDLQGELLVVPGEFYYERTGSAASHQTPRCVCDESPNSVDYPESFYTDISEGSVVRDSAALLNQ